MNGFNYGNPGMVTGQMMWNPYNQSNSLVRVTGIEGAKAYQMNANSTAALFDNNEDLMYIKSTDGAGFPTIRVFKFEELRQDSNKNLNKNYVSRKEMEDYVKHIIQSNNTASNSTNKSKSNTDDKSIV